MSVFEPFCPANSTARTKISIIAGPDDDDQYLLKLTLSFEANTYARLRMKPPFDLHFLSRTACLMNKS